MAKLRNTVTPPLKVKVFNVTERPAIQCKYVDGDGFRSFRRSFKYQLPSQVNRDSTVGTAMGWTAGVRFPAVVRDFSVLHNIQAGSGDHPASYPMGTRGSFPEGKVAGA
jgi:hypothetical protein